MESNRICVVGCSGAGKSTFARSCAALGYTHIELGAIMHQPGWVKLDEETARARIDDLTGIHPRWIVDGNYARFRDLLWRRADTVIWLDLERSVVASSVLWRSLIRLMRREVLWNGNREEWRNVISFDPDRSVVAWAWTQFESYRREYTRQMQSPEWSHLRWVKLCSRREVNLTLVRAARQGRLSLDGE